MRGIEQRGGNKSPESGKKLNGLTVPEGIAITGMAALAAILVGNKIRKRRKRSSQYSPPPEIKKEYRRQ